MKRFDAALPFIKKAAGSKKGLITTPGTNQPDPMMKTVIEVYYGQCLAETGKKKDALKVLQPLAQGGTFDQFQAHPDKNMKHWAWRGYLLVGYSLADLKQFEEANKFLKHSLEIQKKMFEGKIASEFDQNRYLYVIMRTPAYGSVDFKKHAFLNPTFKVTLQKPKEWDFYFVHPEECQRYTNPEAAYQQKRRNHVDGIIMVEKKDTGYSIACQIDIEGIDPSKINYSIKGKQVILANPKAAMEAFYEARKEDYVDLKDVRLIKKHKFNREHRAAYYQFTGGLKKHPDVRVDRALWVVTTRVYTFMISIEGPEGSRKKYRKDIAYFLSRIRITF
jgi:hypothetical protein